MPTNRRPYRRQGIVYGPPRGRERSSENGELIGRFLGLGILLLTLGVLAAGLLAFMGDRGTGLPLATHSGLAVATFSPLPSVESVPPTEPPTAAPTLVPVTAPPATLAPASLPPSTPAVPSATPPLVEIGQGFVTFGTRSNDQLRIEDPRSTFSIDERIVWSAFLSEPADSVDLRIQIFKADDAAAGGERLVVDNEVTPVVADAQIFRERIRPARDLDGPGIYTVRYVRETEIMAQGSFQVTG